MIWACLIKLFISLVDTLLLPMVLITLHYTCFTSRLLELDEHNVRTVLYSRYS